MSTVVPSRLRALPAGLLFTLFVVLVLAATGSATAFILWRLHQSAIEARLDHAELHARAFEDQLTQSLNIVDLTLRNLAAPTTSADLAAVLTRTPFLRSLSLLDSDDRIIVSSHPDNIGRKVITDAWLPLADERELLRFGPPWQGRDYADGAPIDSAAPPPGDALIFLPAMRRSGMQRLLVAVNIDYFINHYARTLDAGIAEILRDDGLLIAATDVRIPAGSIHGEAYRPLLPDDRPFVRLRHIHHLGQTTLSAARISRQYPFLVMVHFDEAAALAGWRAEAIHIVGIVAGGTLLTLLLALLAYLYQRRAAHYRIQAENRLRLAASVFEASAQGIVITDPDGRIASINPAFSAITGYSAAEVIGKTPKVLASGQHDAQFYRTMWQALTERGQWAGEIINRRKDGSIYPEWLTISRIIDTSGAVSNYVGIFSDITERKASEERIRYLSEHDYLTDLPNRALFEDRLQQAIIKGQRHGNLFAVLFLDLDRFKAVNDSLGHHIGDELLRQVARRIQSCLRATDTVCRQGGDEFLVLTDAIELTADAGRIASKIVAHLAETFLIGGHEIAISVSIGIALWPDDGIDGEALIKSADAAMYAAKQQGRNAFQFCTPQINQAASDRLHLEQELRRAIERDELCLYYQPIVGGDGRIIGAEALLRWQHPSLGLLMPARFMRIAEECGLIVPLGEWVLRHACRQGDAWRRAGLPLVTLSINISALQLKQPHFIDCVRAILDETTFPASQLIFEITESVLIENKEQSLAILHALRALGIRLAVDDFGTGYSSLSYLHHLPIDHLKIDRSFIEDVTDGREEALITTTIIGLAHSLHLNVLAEGVETEDQAVFLHQQGCDQFQGYLYAHPMPAEQFAARLSVSAPPTV